MMVLKKALLLLFPLMLLFLTSCDSSADDDAGLTDQELVAGENDICADVNEQYLATEIESDKDENPVERRVLVAYPVNFTSAWAMTDTHFFFTRNWLFYDEFERDYEGNIIPSVDVGLSRLSLDNIAYGELLDLPQGGGVDIVGVTGQYLYISIRNGDWNSWHFDTYKISLVTHETTLIDSGSYFISPTLHTYTNSILFVNRNLDERLVWLEALHIDTGSRKTIYEFEGNAFFPCTSGWMQMEDNGIIFFNCVIGGIGNGTPDHYFIDYELATRQVQSQEIDWWAVWPDRWSDPIWEFLIELEIDAWEYAVTDDWIFYTSSIDNWGGHSHFLGNLHRINHDGTQSTLVRDDINISNLVVVNNILLATIYARREGDGDEPWHEAVVLSEDGDIVKVLGGGGTGHNSYFRIQQLTNTDIVMLIQNGAVHGLYCTATGALFGL